MCEIMNAPMASNGPRKAACSRDRDKKPLVRFRITPMADSDW